MQGCVMHGGTGGTGTALGRYRDHTSQIQGLHWAGTGTALGWPIVRAGIATAYESVAYD